MPELKTIDASQLKTFYPEVDREAPPPASVRIEGNKRALGREYKRRMRDIRRYADAEVALEQLPEPGEGIFILLDGTTSLFHLLAAVLKLAAEPCQSLLVATLGLSKGNVDKFIEWLDGGRLGRLDLLVSKFFRAQEKPNWEYAHGALSQRKDARVVAAQTHAKIFCAAIGQRRIICTSSANLRSCSACEQATIHDDPQLYQFFRDGIEPLFQKGIKHV